LDDPRGKAVFGPMFDQMTTQMLSAFGVSETGTDELGMNMMGFLLDTPLLSLLAFQESALPVPPEEIVDGLLGQVQAEQTGE
jgi:beta-glucosidase